MAVVRVIERPRNTGETALRSGALEYNYERVFQVHVDSYLTRAYAITQDPGIPSIGDAHPDDGASFVTSIRPEQLDDPQYWEVTVGYTSNNGEVTLDPTLRKWDIEWDGQEFIRDDQPEDADGKPFANTCGQLFVPGLAYPDSEPVLKIARNESAFDIGTAVAYYNRTNSDNWAGAAVGQALMKPIKATRFFEGGIEYWRVSYEIHFREDGWLHQVVNHGYAHVEGSGSSAGLVINTDKFGHPLQQPCLLAANGTYLVDPRAAPPDPLPSPVILEFKRYRAVAFGPLALYPFN